MSEDDKPILKLVKLPSGSRGQRRERPHVTQRVSHASEIQELKKIEADGARAIAAFERKLLKGKPKTRSLKDVSVCFQLELTALGYRPTVVIDTASARQTRISFEMGDVQIDLAVYLFDLLDLALRARATIEVI